MKPNSSVWIYYLAHENLTSLEPPQEKLIGKKPKVAKRVRRLSWFIHKISLGSSYSMTL